MTGVLIRRGDAHRGKAETQGEEGHSRAKERGHKRSQPCPHQDLGLPGSGTGRKPISVVS